MRHAQMRRSRESESCSCAAGARQGRPSGRAMFIGAHVLFTNRTIRRTPHDRRISLRGLSCRSAASRRRSGPQAAGINASCCRAQQARLRDIPRKCEPARIRLAGKVDDAVARACSLSLPERSEVLLGARHSAASRESNTSVRSDVGGGFPLFPVSWNAWPGGAAPSTPRRGASTRRFVPASSSQTDGLGGAMKSSC